MSRLRDFTGSADQPSVRLSEWTSRRYNPARVLGIQNTYTQRKIRHPDIYIQNLWLCCLCTKSIHVYQYLGYTTVIDVWKIINWGIFREVARSKMTDIKLGHMIMTQQRRHNKRDGVSNHLRLDCLLSRLLRRRSKKISELCVTGLCEGNPAVSTGDRWIPSQRAGDAKNASIWWRHRYITSYVIRYFTWSPKIIITCARK